MLKKTLFAAISIIAPFSIHAEGISQSAPVIPVAAQVDNFSGFYAGAGMGIAALTANADNMAISSDRSGSHIVLHNAYNAGYHGVVGKLFGGYGQVFNSNYYLGTELFGQVNDLNFNIFNLKLKTEIDSGDIINLKLQNKYSFGVLARAGYLMDQKTMLYIVAGPELSRFDVKDYIGDGYNKLSDNFSKTRLGLAAGIGMEHNFTSNMSVRAQYTYSFYQKFEHTTTIKSYEGTQTLNSSVFPNRSQFTVDLLYRFFGDGEHNSSPSISADNFSGFYAGAGVGAAALTTKIESQRISPKTEKGFPEMIFTYDYNAGHYQAVGKLFGGYGKKIGNNYYLGAEVFGQLNGLNFKSFDGQMQDMTSGKLVNASINIKNKYSLGVLARAGYLMDQDTMLYAVVGPESSKFEIKDVPGSPFSTNNFLKREIGLVTGIGMEHYFIPNLSTRLQYTYSFYKKFGNTIVNQKSGNITTDYVTPNRSQVTVDMSYRF